MDGNIISNGGKIRGALVTCAPTNVHILSYSMESETQLHLRVVMVYPDKKDVEGSGTVCLPYNGLA